MLQVVVWLETTCDGGRDVITWLDRDADRLWWKRKAAAANHNASPDNDVNAPVGPDMGNRRSLQVRRGVGGP